MTRISDNRAAAIIGPMRLSFLTLVPVCVLLGAAAAHLQTGRVPWRQLLLAFAGGLLAHIGVNALNEYDDFRSGLDLKTERTPFSGGSGTLPAQPGRKGYALGTGVLSLAGVFLIGLYFVLRRGWAIAPLGLLGLLVIVAYTPALTRSSVLCLVAPGLGFGTLMVNGTFFALSGRYCWAAFIASLVPFFLVSNLLLINQYPDLEADRLAGRRHLIIARGRGAGVKVFSFFLAACYLAILLGALLGPLPRWSLLGLLTSPLALQVARGLSAERDNTPGLISVMGKNVILTLATPLLVAAGIYFG